MDNQEESSVNVQGSQSIEQVILDFKPTSGVSFRHKRGMTNLVTNTDNKENIQGFAITARDLFQINEVIPGVSDALFSEKGKIVFIGNGLSPAPVELLQAIRESDDEKTPELVIVDLFDYKDLLADFQHLKAQFEQNSIRWPRDLEEKLTACAELVQQINLGKIKAIKYMIGDKHPPDEIRDADLIVVLFGPSNSTFPEQVQCLKNGGRLFTDSIDLPQTPGAEITPILLDGSEIASIVTKV